MRMTSKARRQKASPPIGIGRYDERLSTAGPSGRGVSALPLVPGGRGTSLIYSIGYAAIAKLIAEWLGLVGCGWTCRTISGNKCGLGGTARHVPIRSSRIRKPPVGSSSLPVGSEKWRDLAGLTRGVARARPFVSNHVATGGTTTKN